MREELQEIKRSIYEDGTIAESEVTLLQGVFARYGLGEEEIALLLDLNSVLSGHAHAAAFDQLFIDSVVAFMAAPGDLEARMSWLHARLMKDGIVDELERKALAACAERGIAMSEALRALL